MDQIDESIEFGRYNDDMRIFANDRLTATRALLALQERLLTKGLNLNCSKTKFAEGIEAVDKLRAKAYELAEDLSPGDVDEEEAPLERPQVADMPFDEFQKTFGIRDNLETAQDAKDFCHYLGKKVLISERKRWHIEKLQEILARWHGTAKHAAWRLAESMGRPQCPNATRGFAEDIFLKCLADENVTNYAKYRLLHHLTHCRRSGDKYYGRLQGATQRNVRRLLPPFLAEKAFELNIITLYALRCIGASTAELEDEVKRNVRQPVPLPIKNALSLASESTPKRPKQLPAFAPIGDEKGETEDHY